MLHENAQFDFEISYIIISYVDRGTYIERIRERFRNSPVVALLGPRQVGKTTLARMYRRSLEAESRREANYLDLENPLDLARLESPMLALQDLKGLVVIDEVQRAPGIFQILRVLVDRDDNPARFLILGSASRDLIGQSSETLAGRISFIEVSPFSLREVGEREYRKLWVRGGLPRSFLADDETVSQQWRNDYVQTFLERDIPSLGIQIPPARLRRMWLMLAHSHGQILNASELGGSLEISEHTAKRYVDILASTFMVRQLAPWFENIGKRQVKRPKVYLRDSGLFHALLGVGDYEQLLVHPKLGASWEGFALEEVIKASGASSEEVFFWGVHQQAELDLLIMKQGRRMGFEFKYTDRPTVTASMEAARELLKLDVLSVVHPTGEGFPLTEQIRAESLAGVVRRLASGRAK